MTVSSDSIERDELRVQLVTVKETHQRRRRDADLQTDPEPQYEKVLAQRVDEVEGIGHCTIHVLGTHIGRVASLDPGFGVIERRHGHVVENHTEPGLEVHLLPAIEMCPIILLDIDQVAESFQRNPTLDDAAEAPRVVRIQDPRQRVDHLLIVSPDPQPPLDTARPDTGEWEEEPRPLVPWLVLDEAVSGDLAPLRIAVGISVGTYSVAIDLHFDAVEAEWLPGRDRCEIEHCTGGIAENTLDDSPIDEPEPTRTAAPVVEASGTQPPKTLQQRFPELRIDNDSAPTRTAQDERAFGD